MQPDPQGSGYWQHTFIIIVELHKNIKFTGDLVELLAVVLL